MGVRDVNKMVCDTYGTARCDTVQHGEFGDGSSVV